MADVAEPTAKLNHDQNRAAATVSKVITKESSLLTKTASRLRGRPSFRHLSAIDKDMMEWSGSGELTGVRYEDEKGLGGCRIQ